MTPGGSTGDSNRHDSRSHPGTLKFLPEEFYEPFLSQSAKEKKPSPIRGLLHLESRPNVISLLAGKPNPTLFPITNVDISVKSPTDPSKESVLQISGSDLDEALQYGPTAGHPGLLKWLTGLQEHAHGRKAGEGWRINVGSGSQDVLYKAFVALVNDGDPVLIESPAYAGFISVLPTLHSEVIEVPTDANGIKASSLREILDNWPSSKPKPKILYTVPYGCNPTGMTATVERRREVLALAKEHNFLILEDDPYYYLYYGAMPRPPSYFTLETELSEVGRVLRFDSFSKIISSGIRIGFVSGPTKILDAVNLHTETSNLQVSSLTQVMTYTLLRSWGYDAFITHTEAVSEFYRKKCDVFEQAMVRQLGGLTSWTTPVSGMFFWFKLLLNSPDSPNAVTEDSETIIRTKALENGVLALPGTVFLPGGGKTAYVRASFSLLEAEGVEEALRRLKEVILEARAVSTCNKD
ncbi:PLP-dependent transferase [Rickenella mellea]|uniref:PLP-dependent transferase n=1 Tax=Rickenella mellea TaxID=50990 RepID=A0A4Y7QFU2_9AGAM|nr:PLP-dependent transferase [Rickenella mellea]